MGACARNMYSDSAEIKPAQCCIKLVFHLTYTMMHGSTKLKLQKRSHTTSKDIMQTLVPKSQVIYMQGLQMLHINSFFVFINVKHSTNSQTQATIYVRVEHQLQKERSLNQFQIFNIFYIKAQNVKNFRLTFMLLSLVIQESLQLIKHVITNQSGAYVLV